jgi:leucine dehydrogenase
VSSERGPQIRRPLLERTGGREKEKTMIFDCADYDDAESVIFVADRATGLRGIIAIHSAVLGPGLGGCRMVAHTSEAGAARDVLRLSRGMTYKNALADLPLGRGKMVVIGDPAIGKSPALFAAIGQAVERLGGQYIVGTEASGRGRQ